MHLNSQIYAVFIWQGFVEQRLCHLQLLALLEQELTLMQEQLQPQVLQVYCPVFDPLVQRQLLRCPLDPRVKYRAIHL